ncbi:putative B3 domain-containing protein [Spatholobus suberectus]|nr:putative B3 domain-containing protein [Spatholobus suberectus]
MREREKKKEEEEEGKEEEEEEEAGEDEKEPKIGMTFNSKDEITTASHNLLESVAEQIATIALAKHRQICVVSCASWKPHVAFGAVDYLDVEILRHKRDVANHTAISLFSKIYKNRIKRLTYSGKPGNGNPIFENHSVRKLVQSAAPSSSSSPFRYSKNLDIAAKAVVADFFIKTMCHTVLLFLQMAKGCTINTYEEARKQRLEENKKRFEDLGISRISKKLIEITSSAKKPQHHHPKLKPNKTNGEVEPRRSSRVRNTVPSYREDVTVDFPPLRKRSRSNSSTWGSYVARPLDEIKEATEEERLCALEAAEALQINLNSSNPSFIKSMVRSHVYSCFWLGLPSKFCEEHLPKTVYDMVLEDENGSEYEAVYIGNRSGLSGGWRAFALDHKLDDGDALVFELIEASRFKIYIVRAFPDSVEEKGKDILEEEGNMSATKAPKVACNLESESKTKKPKQAMVYETVESESSQEHLPDGSIDNEVKPQGVNPTKKTKFSQKNIQAAESKGKVVLKTEKRKASVKLSNKTRKSQKGIANEIGDSGKSEKNGFVQDADSKLEKVELVEEASKCVSQKARKKPAPRFFRKKA